ncbi:hypothetical protein AAZX31_07G087900 [Glycine max]
MNPSSNNHTVEPKDLGNSSANFNGVNSLQSKVSSEAKLQRVLQSPVMTEQPTTLISQVGHKFPKVFRLRQGSYADLPSQKISELMKSTMNDILEESVERRNGEIPHRLACLLRKVVQEIERRISTQVEHLKTQNNLFKAREEKYHSKIKVLEAFASKTKEETEMENDLKQIEDTKKMANDKEVIRYTKELEDKNMEISTLKQELETMRKTYELEAKVEDAKEELKHKSQEYENLLEKLRSKVKENEALSESKYQKWTMIENQIRKAKLKLSWESIKQDAMKEQKIYSEECNRLGINLKSLVDTAKSYQTVLAENRKLFNEVQELKGNIRRKKQSIVEHIGETDLFVANPAKQGKEALSSTRLQFLVYVEIQDFIRSVLDGFNVCIFAYGQTGLGKTYTMIKDLLILLDIIISLSGPNGATTESLGVNYRALNDLFSISTSRKSSIVYDIGVQIIEIYNEQVPVPDATMQPVKSTLDVIKLMDIGLKNRAKGSTAMNERSSRSHSVVSIHVCGMDKKFGSSLHSNLHLVDLAGSERVDRSKVTGDKLKEAQHINKSLSAFGDVIFALAQKTSHVPYRNSKLTQLLQSSLGGQAKTVITLKFVGRVFGIELGAAKSTKDGRDVRELMEHVSSLKDTILVKDEEIEKLQLLKDLKSDYPGVNSENLETTSE